MVEERVLAVPNTSVFIAELPEETRDIIRNDMRQHAREKGYRLEWDMEAKDYVGMTRRFCDIDSIYKETVLRFCEPGEDVQPYKNSLKRNISINLYSDEVEDLCRTAAGVGMTVSKLFENFVADLIEGTKTNGSDERMYIDQWFRRCAFSMFREETFLSYLTDWRLVDRVVAIWNDIQELEGMEELDAYDKSELESLWEDLNEEFQSYQDTAFKPEEQNLEEAMKRVVVWNEERQNMLKGTTMEKPIVR